MKRTKFLPPYKKEGQKYKTTFADAKGKSGVYFIKENGKLVYIGYSSTNIYKTLYRHFQHWTHPLQYVVSYAGKMKHNKYTVSVCYCTPKQAVTLERNFIIKLRPRDCDIKYKNYTETASEKAYKGKTVDTFNNTTQEMPF